MLYINERVSVFLVNLSDYVKDLTFKKLFLLTFKMATILIFLIYVIYLVTLGVDKYSEVKEFRVEEPMIIRGFLAADANITLNDARMYYLNIANFKSIEKVNNENKIAWNIIMHNNKNITIYFNNEQDREDMKNGILNTVDNYKTNRKINFK